MKPLRQRLIALLLLCIVGVLAALTGSSYLQYVTQQIDEDAASHLVEIYSQVNNTFHTFLEQNWGNLEDWGSYMRFASDDAIQVFLDQRQSRWGFSRFYFVGADGASMTPLQKAGELALADEQKYELLGARAPIMAEQTLPDGRAATLFAVPVPVSSYRGFIYSAVAVSYTNADIVRSLSVNAFDGQSQCFIVYSDGSVILSTQEGGSVYGNYLSYLRAGSDFEEADLERLRTDWETGQSGVLRCQIGGVEQYISYQPVGFRDCVLLGVAPAQVASASLRRIQHATVNVLMKLFLMVGVLALAQLLYYSMEQRRKNASELRYRELMFDTLSKNVSDIFIMLDRKTWRVDYVSPNIERQLGVTADSLLEDIRLLEDTIEDEGGAVNKDQLLDIAIHSERFWEREHIHQQTGERCYYRGAVYHEDLLGTEKFLIVLSDRTRERKMNRNLQEALDAARSANRAKSHFLSNMSHDIRTPMNAIIGLTILLARDAEHPDKVREYTRKISASSQHLLGLINDILDMSKIESGKTSLNIAPFSLPELMEELHTILLPQARAKHQRLDFYVQGSPAEQLQGDKLRLNQILINLLSNAIKYTQDGGRIECIVQGLPQSSPQYARLCFAVRDNGMGMAKEFQETIFDAFTREENAAVSGIQGTGLGMAITRNLVELMGGVIRVSSEPGKGSTFTVDLSFAVPAAESGDSVWDRYGISRVLAADDEQEICDGIASMLQDSGVEAVCVRGGEAAAAAAAEAQAEGRPFDIVLLDWSMPGLSGAETARRIRETQDVPIMVMTSYGWEDIEEEARAAGIRGFLPKPFFVSNFQHAIEAMNAAPEESAGDGVEDNALEGMLFLVAEDNELNAEILSELLEMEGARCEITGDGQQVLDAFQASEPGRFDMILMDVQMPVMDGYEATRRIRACGHPQAHSIPIVAMTANAFAEDVRKAMEAGMDGHLAKPIHMEIVKSLLGQLRSGSRPAGPEGGKGT